MAENTPKSPIIQFGFAEGDDGQPPPEQSYDDYVAECRAKWPSQEVNPNVVIEGGVLLCPVCGGNNLHQGKVRVYQRDHEDGPGTLTVVSAPDSVSVSRLEDKDSPGRRDTLRIEFGCEDICRPFTLEIQQHKGLTYMMWLADPIPEYVYKDPTPTK